MVEAKSAISDLACHMMVRTSGPIVSPADFWGMGNLLETRFFTPALLRSRLFGMFEKAINEYPCGCIGKSRFSRCGLGTLSGVFLKTDAAGRFQILPFSRYAILTKTNPIKPGACP